MRGISIMFGFGLALLALLVAADRPHWFGLTDAGAGTVVAPADAGSRGVIAFAGQRGG